MAKTKKAAPAQAKAPVSEKKAKATPKPHPCACGCGTLLPRPKARFAQGHDARLKGVLQRMARGVPLVSDRIPEEAKHLLATDGVAGITVRGGTIALPPSMQPRAQRAKTA